MFRWHVCLYVLITLICLNTIHAQDCSSFSSCDSCAQHACAWCKTSSREGVTHICTTNATCSVEYATYTCPQEVSTRVWSNSIFILFLVFAIIMGIVIPLTNGKRTQTLEEDVVTMASNEQTQTLVMGGEERVSSSSLETTDTAYCGFYTSSPSFASCCGVTVRQVFVSDEKFVVLSSNRAKMFFLLALVLLVHGLWIGITFYLSGEDTNVGAMIFVLIICVIQISIIIFYLWSVTIAIIDRTENQLVLKRYHSICNVESSQRYDIDTMSRIAIHRESMNTGIQHICGETVLGWMKTWKRWNAKRKGNRIYHVTLMSQNGPITVIHNESLSSARLLRSRLGDFLRANQLYVLHQSSVTSSYQPATPRTVEEMRRMSSDNVVDTTGRRTSGYAQHDTSDATQTLLNGHSHDDMEEKYNSQHDATKNDIYV